RGDDLRFRVELHPEAARVVGGLGTAQARYPLGRRITIGARLADCFLELLDDVPWRWQVRVAHAEIDDVGAAIAGEGLGPVDLLEDVGREAAGWGGILPWGLR